MHRRPADDSRLADKTQFHLKFEVGLRFAQKTMGRTARD